MHYNLYFKALDVLDGEDIDEYILNNDISTLFGRYDESDILLLKGIEVYVLVHEFSKSKLLKKVKKDIYDAFILEPRKYFDSYLFENVKDLFSFFEIRKINRFMKGLEIQANGIMMRGPKDKEELQFLMKYMKKNIDLDDKYQKEYISKILDKNISELCMEEYNFLCSYMGRWMFRKSGNEDIDAEIFACKFPDSGAGGYTNGNVIEINILDDDFDIPYLLKCVAHEVEHVIQNSMYKRLSKDDENHKDSKIGLDFLEYLGMDDEYYRKNYWFLEIEYDAEKKGIEFTLSFLSSFGKNVSGERFYKSDYLAHKPYEFKMQPICYDYEKEFKEYARVSNFDFIVKNCPSVLDNYPILRKLYYYNGERISFHSMISNDFSLDDNFEIFYDFVFNYIQNGKLDHYIAGDLQFNNIRMIYDKVHDKVLSMFSYDFDLSFLEDYGINISCDDMNDIFTSEITYYTSFLTKVSKFISKNKRRLSDDDLVKFEMRIYSILDSISSVLEGNVSNFKLNNSKFLENNFSDLLYIYNDLREDDIKKNIASRFEIIVPPSLWNLKYSGVNIKDYVCEQLYRNVSYKGFKVNIDGREFDMDDYINLFISKCLGRDSRNIINDGFDNVRDVMKK